MAWLVKSTILLIGLTLCVRNAQGFCGFYVAKADTKLFNKASQVVLVRHEQKTVLTMVNDYQGDPQEFALVVPVPTVLEREQIHVGNKAVVDHLDAYSAPRLVEYYDPDPCRRMEMMAAAPAPSARNMEDAKERDKSLGVTVEARYTVGEYDIVILSAEQSTGLETWLQQNGYRIPAGASPILGSYIKQGLRFFVAKVNLKEQSRLGFAYLRPLQIAYDSPRFMLPIRLGTVNANGSQDLYIFALTRKGRVETTNYRTVRLPTGMDLPGFVKQEFGEFYQAMFTHQVQKEEMRAVFLEYAWDMGWCDPCAADPLSAEELRQLGVFWGNATPGRVRPPQPSQDVFITRLHVRYDAEHFPEDLFFQETADRTNFQGRYVIRHAWQGEATCPAVQEYRASLPQRRDKEVQELAALTGWNVGEIRKKMPGEPGDVEPQKWWRKLWKD